MFFFFRCYAITDDFMLAMLFHYFTPLYFAFFMLLMFFASHFALLAAYARVRDARTKRRYEQRRCCLC